MITIDDFLNIELKIATITEVLDHPNADKLLVIKVNVGDEQRQIVAGIKGHYQPDQLMGKQVVLVANLQPAVVRGIESQGMLLAAADELGVRIISPDAFVKPGARVR